MEEQKEDREMKQLLKDNLETSQETLKYVKKLNSARVHANIFGIVRFIVIIGISFGAFYYIEPYLNKAVETLGDVAATLNQVKQTGENLQTGATNLQKNLSLPQELMDIIDSLKEQK